MNNTLTGRCLCGQVNFSIENRFEDLFHCYCDRCRRMTGSAHASNLFVENGKVDWVSGRHLVREYTLPDTRFCNAFCGTCGSALPYICTDGKTVLVPAGALDQEPRYDRETRIYLSEKTGWCPDHQDIAGFSEDVE